MKYLISEKRLEELSGGWKVKNGELHKKFEFDSYVNVMKFVNKVMKIAEEQNHHPKLIVNYDNVEVFMFDHEANKISDKCHKFVKAVNKLK